MQRTNVTLTVFGFFFLFVAGNLVASEIDELRQRAIALRKEASVLAQRGNKEKAERLEQESIELLEAAERLELKAKRREEKEDRPGIEKEAGHLQEQLHDLLVRERKLKEAMAPRQALAEIREQIAHTENALQRIRAHAKHKQNSEVHDLETATRRIHHLRVAAENLMAAEAHDLARQVMEKAEAIEREVHERRKQIAAEKEHSHGETRVMEVVQELRREVERLRAEVKELRRKVEDR